MKKNPFSKWRASLTCVAGLCCALVLFEGCAKKSAADQSAAARPVIVRAEPVVYSTEAIPVYATGILSRKAEANLSFKIGGIVEEVAVRVGDRVKKGDVLAKLRLTEIDAQVVRARAALEKAQRDLERTEKLRADNVATLENLQDAQTAVDAADASVKIAVFNRDHAVIVAPAAGRILRRFTEPEEMIEAGHPALVFASDDSGWIVRAGIAGVDVLRLQAGNPAEVTIDGLGSERVKALVTQISEAAEAATRTTEVELALETVPVGARSGFVVRAAIRPAPVSERPVVPASALIEGMGEKAWLFLVGKDGSVAKRMQVVVAGIEDTKAYLGTPLPRDSSVVVSGAEYLRDGAAVQIVKE
jgi:RND family efflux transporter MFP subunit